MKHENRAYQQEIEDAVFDYLFEETGNPVVAAPGGTGKSLCMAKITKRLVKDWPGTRVILLAQDSKLLDQNSNELLKLWPTAPVGIYSAGLKMRDTKQPIIFAGIQSVAKRAAEFGVRNIVIVDECDQISHKEETLYQKFICELKAVNPKLRVIGFTATAYRLGTGCLTNLDLWDRIVIDLTKTERFNWFVENGFLAPLVTKKTAKEIDVTHIAMKGGEFDEKSMQDIVDTEELNRAVVDECIRYGADRKHWLVFSSGVKHGHKLAKLFNAKGIPTIMVSGEDSMAHREEQEKLFREGKVRCLVNCGLYGRGWNFRALDMIAMARATQSTALWVQCVVRGTRTAPGKDNCIARGQRVLTDHGLVEIQDVSREMKVWDGLDFVEHSGAICRGIQPTITYAGLTATADHKVKTLEGWKTLGQAFLEQTPIRVTGANERPLRETDNYFRSAGATGGNYVTSFCSDAVRSLREGISSRLYKSISWQRWLSKMRSEAIQAANPSAMALQQVLCSTGEVRKSKRSSLRTLWWKGNQVSFQKSSSNGRLDSGQSRFGKRERVRSYQEQRTLRAGEHSIFDAIAEPISHATKIKQYICKLISSKSPRNTLCRHYATKLVSSWLYARRNRRTVLPTFVQTEREVWDILNCGPRHSFTCEGLLVHNCLVLDFAENIRRLGPINDPIIPAPRRKGEAVKGEAPVKECPQCFSYLHTRVMVCPDCGYQFPPPQTIKKTASDEDIMKGAKKLPQIEDYEVYGIRYKNYTSRKTGTEYLRVTYFVGTDSFNENLFFNSESLFVRKNLKIWWTHRGGLLPCPNDTVEALERAADELRTPTIIRVDVNSPYKEVVGCDFTEDADVPF